MKRNPKLVRAAEVASATKNAGGVYVFATTNLAVPEMANASAFLSKQKFASFACADCSTEFASVPMDKGSTPFCVLCGSEETVLKSEKASVTLPKKDSELAHFECPTCDVANVVSAVTAKAAGHKMHCSVCSTPVKYALADALDDDLDDMDMVDTGDDSDGTMDTVDTVDLDMTDPSGNDIDPVLDPSMTDPVDDDSLDLDLDDDDTDTVMADNHDELPPKVMREQMDKNLNGGMTKTGMGETDTADEFDRKRDPSNDNTVLDPAIRGEDGTAPIGYVDGKSITKPKAQASLETSVNMLDAESGETLKEVAFFTQSGKLNLVANHTIVASLSEEDAGENAPIMFSAEFANAVGHTIRTKGLREAASNYGFKPVVVKLPVKNIVESNTKRAVETATAELVKAQNEVAEDFKQSLDLAAAGLAKNFFRNRQNPLAAALERELSAVGIRNPKRIVARVFETQAIAYNKEILSLARVLAAKSVDARNELSDSIDLASFQAFAESHQATASVDPDSEDDDSDDDESVASEITAGIKPLQAVEVSSTPRRSETTASIVTRIAGEHAGNLFPF